MIQSEKDRETAQKVVNKFLSKMNVELGGTVTEDLLEQFKEDFIQRLVEKKPFVCKCDHAPDELFFQRMRGLEELTPYFSFKLSVLIFWNTGAVHDQSFD